MMIQAMYSDVIFSGEGGQPAYLPPIFNAHINIEKDLYNATKFRAGFSLSLFQKMRDKELTTLAINESHLFGRV